MSELQSDFVVFSKEDARDRVFVDDRQIAAKQRIHATYRTNPRTIVDHVLECLECNPGDAVLDLGCGNGFFLEPVAEIVTRGRLVGVDVAPGVLDAAKRRSTERGISVEWLEGSADDLAMFETESFDRVMANYMMHYVPDIEGALSEVRRLLRPGGIFVLATDSVSTMAEMYDAHFEALKRLGWPDRYFKKSPKGRFSLEVGRAMLEQVFSSVSIREYGDVLRIDNVDAFMEFYAVGNNYCSARSMHDGASDAELARLHEEVERSVAQRIAATGSFVITKRTGAFVCR